MNKGRYPKLWFVMLTNFSRLQARKCNYFSGLKLLNMSLRKTNMLKPAVTMIMPSLLLFAKTVSKEDESSTEWKEKKLIGAADQLYELGKYDELYELLINYKDSVQPEILWRLARALFEKSRTKLANKEKLAILEEAYDYVQKALEIDENCWAAHKWCAILTDYVWRQKSTKGRIEHSFDIRKHMKKAIELNPSDSTSYYLLGEWCYTFADLPWYQRKVASVLFATPPTSTFEEALSYFEKAEEISPNFYSMNLLMMGKCLLKLQRKDEALTFLKQARDYPVKTPDDHQAHAEATDLLKSLGVKD